MPPTLGSLAPDFELTLVPEEAPLRLSDYRGHKPVLILFFPLAFSGTCSKEFRVLRDDMAAWDELGAAIIGVSVDSPYANQRFAEQCGVPFPVLSDFNKEATRAYGVYNEDFQGMDGVSDRSAFIVDLDGVLRHSWVADHPDQLPDFERLKDEVAGLG